METLISTKGQIVIPAQLRRKHGLKAGTRMAIGEDGGRLILRPLTRDYVRRLKGSLRGGKALKILAGQRRRESDL